LAGWIVEKGRTPHNWGNTEGVRIPTWSTERLTDGEVNRRRWFVQLYFLANRIRRPCVAGRDCAEGAP